MRRPDLLPDPWRFERALFVDLIAGHELTSASFETISAVHWFEVIPESLYPLAYASLAPWTRQFGVAAELSQRLQVFHRSNALLALKRRSLLRQAIAIFVDAAIPYLVLKGPLVASLYADPATRTMADFDFLVRQEDLGRAVDAFRQNGFVVPDRMIGGTTEPGDAPPMTAPDHPETLVEIHSILESTDDLDSVWLRAQKYEADGIEFTAPGPADFFTHVALHASRHHMFDAQLRSIFDVHRLLINWRERLDWSSLQNEWKTQGVERWMMVTLLLANVLFDAPLPFAIDEEGFEEPLKLAALQVWRRMADRLPFRVGLLTGTAVQQPVFTTVKRERLRVPSGVAGLRIRASKMALRIGRVVGALGRGALRPQNLRLAAQRFQERQRLTELLERES